MERHFRRTAPALDRLGVPLSLVLGALSARWSLLILEGLASGHVRFNELQRHLTGISHKVLIENLRILQRDGFVHGPLTADRPDREPGAVTEYGLTTMGRELLDWVGEIRRWAESQEALASRG